MANLLTILLLLSVIAICLGRPLDDKAIKKRSISGGKSTGIPKTKVMEFFRWANSRLDAHTNAGARKSAEHLLFASLLRLQRHNVPVDVHKAQFLIYRALRNGLAMAEHHGVKQALALAHHFPNIPKPKTSKGKQAHQADEKAKKLNQQHLAQVHAAQVHAAQIQAAVAAAKQKLIQQHIAQMHAAVHHLVAPSQFHHPLAANHPASQHTATHVVIRTQLANLINTLQGLSQRIKTYLATKHETSMKHIPAMLGLHAKRHSEDQQKSSISDAVAVEDNKNDEPSQDDQTSDVMDLLEQNQESQGAASDQQAAETYDQDTFNAGFDEDDDSEAILMEDNDLDDALDDFNQAEMLDDVDSLGQEEDENFAGEEDLNKEVAKDESKLLNGAMDKYHEALSRYNHAVEAVKSYMSSHHT